MPVIMFSTFWVPTTFMPGWYQTVAIWDPFNPVLAAGRSAMLGAGGWHDLAVGITAMATPAGLAYTLAIRRFTRLSTAD